ncbi:MAG: alpha/beta fold hydrolase [Phycisphaeraceae bacterium]|nr:alpha/beta fold hydrolase [Phycisphaeraceae bacterium]MCB9847147.1 alpha/beta fold hydrolase [Phycisphaeraceae bacterium]
MAFSARLVSVLVAVVVTVLSAGSARAGEAAGGLTQQWVGRFEMNGASLTFTVDLTPDAGGALAGTISIPFQNIKDMALTEAAFESRQVTLAVGAPTDAVFKGRLSPDGKTVTGTMTQGENEFPFTLERMVALSDAGEVVRPQTPSGQAPHRTRGVTIQVEGEDVTLGGSLMIPEGEGPFPCAVLLSGSGPQDRNEAMFGHKPFLVLADALARAGVATLRCDDRGVGNSTGELIQSTDADLAVDALAMVKFLESQTEIDSGRIGIIGHDEGGIVGAIAASRSADVSFLVLLAAPGMPGHELVTAQSERILGAIGMPAAQIQEAVIATQAAHRIVMNKADDADVEWELRARIAEAYLAMYPPDQRAMVPDVGDQVAAQVKQLLTPWFRHFLAYNPTQAYLDVHCPTLAVCGSLDLQVDAAENLALIEQALKSAGNERVTVRQLDRVNHMLQPANTGLPAEYGVIETTIDPRVLDLVTVWVGEQTGAGGR